MKFHESRGVNYWDLSQHFAKDLIRVIEYHTETVSIKTPRFAA